MRLALAEEAASLSNMSEAAQKTVTIPMSVFETAESKEELEDWLLANDPSFVKEMERIQREESGCGVSLNEAAEKWHIKS